MAGWGKRERVCVCVRVSVWGLGMDHTSMFRVSVQPLPAASTSPRADRSVCPSPWCRGEGRGQGMETQMASSRPHLPSTSSCLLAPLWAHTAQRSSTPGRFWFLPGGLRDAQGTREKEPRMPLWSSLSPATFLPRWRVLCNPRGSL